MVMSGQLTKFSFRLIRASRDRPVREGQRITRPGDDHRRSVDPSERNSRILICPEGAASTFGIAGDKQDKKRQMGRGSDE